MKGLLGRRNCYKCREIARHDIRVRGEELVHACCSHTDKAMVVASCLVPNKEATNGLAAFRRNHVRTCGYKP